MANKVKRKQIISSSSDESDVDLPISVVKHIQRNRKVPKRFGELAELVENNSDEKDLFEDNGSEDEYNPPRKKQKNSNLRENLMDLEHSFFINLNDEFNQLKSSTLVSSTPKAGNHLNERRKSSMVTSSKISHRTSSENDQNNNADGDLLSRFKAFSEQTHELFKQTMARLSLIEDVLMKNPIGNSTLGIDKNPNIDTSNMFAKSNYLPLNLIEHVKEFESKLEDPDFKKAAVSMFYHNIFWLLIVCFFGLRLSINFHLSNC